MSNGGAAAIQVPTQQISPPTFFSIKDLLMAPFKGFMGSKPEGGAFKDPSGKTFFDFSEIDINADPIDFSSLKGKKAILVVNVASQWGLTDSNYKALVQMKSQLADQIEIIAYPCNQFGG